MLSRLGTWRDFKLLDGNINISSASKIIKNADFEVEIRPPLFFKSTNFENDEDLQ